MKSTLMKLPNVLNLKNKAFYNTILRTAVTKTRKIDPFDASSAVNTHPTPNPQRLKGKFAVVSGATGAVGRETAELFAASGIEGLTITDLDDTKGKQLAEKLNDLYKKKIAHFVKTDVSKDEEVQRLFTEHMQHFGKLNVLFNNAGIMMQDDGTPLDTSLASWEKTMAVNSTSVFLACKYAIPHMLNTKQPCSIINVASIVALVGSASAQIAYTASKGAVLSMSKEMGIIYARDNIRVNAVCPGPLYTDLLKYLLDTDEKLDRRLAHLPIGRFGHPKEIAQATAFLASDESSLVNASQFVVDGGLTSAYLTPL